MQGQKEESKTIEYEKILVEKFKAAKEKKAAIELQLEEASKVYNDIEDELIRFLEEDGNRKKTSVYRGMGWVTIVDKALSASIEEGRQDDVLTFVRNIGREDMIKTSIHSKTLSSFVEGLLQANQELPPGVTFYRPRKARFYPAKD